MINIRTEKADDIPAVHQVNEFAFGRTDEAALVDRLRTANNPYISLVAVENEQIVGHIFLVPFQSNLKLQTCLQWVLRQWQFYLNGRIRASAPCLCEKVWKNVGVWVAMWLLYLDILNTIRALVLLRLVKKVLVANIRCLTKYLW